MLIKYESKTIMPDDIKELIVIMERDIKSDRYDNQKIMCHIASFRFQLIVWLREHRVKELINEKDT